MNTSQRALLGAAAMLAAACVCQAWVYTRYESVVPIPGLPGYHGYTISLVSNTAEEPAGFAGSSPDGFHGAFNQVMAFGALPTPTLTNANLIFPPFGEPEHDSHFLFEDWDILAADPPSETDYHLGGTFTVKPSARSNPLPLAYLVVPDNIGMWLSGTAWNASGIESPVDLPFWQQWPPVADANGPYTIDVGESLSLDGSASIDREEHDIMSYRWDLDGDGLFETDAGTEALFTVSYAELESLGLGGGQYAIELQVTDSWNLQDTAGTTLTIIPEPAALALLALGGLALIRRRRA